MPGNLFLKTCTPEYTATVCLVQRPFPANSPWLIFCGTYPRMYAFGKGLLELITLKYSFYLFSAASWKVYEAPLKLARQVLCCPLLVSKAFLSLSLFFFFQFYLFIYLLHNIVLVLPYIDMNPPWVYICFPFWTPLPPPSPSHPSGSSQCTSPF